MSQGDTRAARDRKIWEDGIIDGRRHRWMDRETDGLTDRQGHRWTDRQTGTQMDGQIETDRQKNRFK